MEAKWFTFDKAELTSELSCMPLPILLNALARGRPFQRLTTSSHSMSAATFVVAVAEAFDALADFVDRSDPDILLPNREHGLQTGTCNG